MSYKQAVLRDDPISFWPLTGNVTLRTYATILEEYQTYQQWINSEANYGYEIGSYTFEDASPKNNHAAIAFGTQQPIFKDILTLNSRLFSDTNYSGCKISDSSIISIFDIYKFFDQGYEKGIFGAEFWISFPESPTSQTNLLSIVNGSSIIAQAYALNDTICFNVNGSTGSYITKKQIHSWHEKLHVFVLYSEKTIQVFVNGISDEIIQLPTSFTFTTTDNTYVKYRVGPAPSGKSFVINDLAFYNRSLSLNEIRSHMVWASINSGPEYFAQQTSAHHFDIASRKEMVHSQKLFSTNADYNEGTYYNLVPDANGLTFSQTESAAASTGIWYYNFPIIQYQNFAGISISWDSGSNPISSASNQYASVYASYDGGTTWFSVYKNEIVPYFLSTTSNATSAQLFIKVQINSSDTSQTIQPRIDNLLVKIYKSLSIPADSGGFVLSPATSQTYMIREDDSNILLREKNIGLHFVNQNPSSGYPGTAIINSSNNSNYQTVEFWFRYESCQNSSLGAVLDTSTVSGVDLYVNPSTNMLVSNLGANGSLYVNGFIQPSGQYTIVAGETYYVALTYNTSTNNPIYVNGSTDGLSTPLRAMYGYITLFPSVLSSTDIQTRYLSYISTQTAAVYDSMTTLGSIAEFSGNSSASINGGVPVLAHNHIY
jgi:hypothetical protein